MSGNITRKTNFLVIGDIGNELWLHSSYGTKIKKAMDYREAGVPLASISSSGRRRRFAEACIGLAHLSVNPPRSH